jgi:metallo-beta-lactamase family protein
MAEPTVTFWGAARTVTGSMHLVEAGDRRVLLDCGLERGPRAEVRPREEFPFDPRSIDAVILTHAHTDHCGLLPALVRQGFEGPIYCTAATRDLTAVMLADSARIRESRAMAAAIAGVPSADEGAYYGRPDAEHAVRDCVTVEYGEVISLGNDVEFTLADAGHLLGSAMVHVRIAGSRRQRSLTYTGDLGRRRLPLHGPPAPVPPADLLISESTYGGVRHDSFEQTTELLAEIVRRTIDRDGKVLIPAFSLGRTELVLHVLRTAVRDGLLPRVPIFVDGPLACDILDVYHAHAPELHGPDGGGADVSFDDLDVTYLRGVEESRELNERREPCVIVAASGMCEAGRILHHLKHNLDDPRASVILVSFQAPLTVGARLLERGPTVRFLGREWNKWADVYKLEGFSGHADQDDFDALLGPLAGSVHQVRLVHGEQVRAEALAKALAGFGVRDVAVPAKGESVAIGEGSRD